MKGSIRIRNEKYSYYFKYKDEFGKWRSKEKGGFATKKAAESAMRKAIIDWEEFNHMVTKVTNLTLNECTDYWFENIGNLKLRQLTLDSYQSNYKLHIYPHLGSIKIADINTKILQDFFLKMQTKRSSSAVHIIKSILSNVFKLAYRLDFIRSNPMKLVEVPHKKRVRKKLDVNNKDKLLDILNEVEGTDFYTPFYIALHTGLRRGEVLALMWGDVDFENNTIKVYKQYQNTNHGLKEIVDTKTLSSNRVILMTDDLHNYLNELKLCIEERKKFYGEHYSYHEGDSFISSREDGTPIIPRSLSYKARYVALKLGIDFTFHHLRHAHASLMLEADINLKVIQERLGHTDIQTTMNIYSEVSDQLEKESIERFNTRIKLQTTRHHA